MLCLDPAHCTEIQKQADATLRVTSCPLQVTRYLDLDPRQVVVLDRCRCVLDCCRRPLAELQKRIHQAVHGPERLLETTSASQPARGRGDGRRLTERLREVCRHLEGRTPQEVTLTDLARLFGVSPRHLNRLFHLAGAGSPMRALRRERLLEVIPRIEASSRSIEAIADELQYHDRASFARAFRRAFGFYPGRLRKRRPETRS